uniref:Orf3 protein n=1 Tax=Kudoa iwatai TaxID=269814 RepID=A0A0H5AY37_9CNID|nr:orf3 protein [Kudoa iwatai]
MISFSFISLFSWDVWFFLIILELFVFLSIQFFMSWKYIVVFLSMSSWSILSFILSFYYYNPVMLFIYKFISFSILRWHVILCISLSYVYVFSFEVSFLLGLLMVSTWWSGLGIGWLLLGLLFRSWSFPFYISFLMVSGGSFYIFVMISYDSFLYTFWILFPCYVYMLYFILVFPSLYWFYLLLCGFSFSPVVFLEYVILLGYSQSCLCCLLFWLILFLIIYMVFSHKSSSSLVTLCSFEQTFIPLQVGVSLSLLFPVVNLLFKEDLPQETVS